MLITTLIIAACFLIEVVGSIQIVGARKVFLYTFCTDISHYLRNHSYFPLSSTLQKLFKSQISLSFQTEITKCRIWFMSVTLLVLALCVTLKLINIGVIVSVWYVGGGTKHEDLAVSLIFSEILGITLRCIIEAYQLWVVNAFVKELNPEIQNTVPSHCMFKTVFVFWIVH